MRSAAFRTASPRHHAGLHAEPIDLAAALVRRQSWDAGWFAMPLTSFPSPSTSVDLLRADRFELPSNTIVPFGVDSELFEQDYEVDDLRQRHEIAPDEKVLLFVGKVMSPKGAFDWLEVLRGCCAAGRQLRLIMIGDVHARENEICSPPDSRPWA